MKKLPYIPNKDMYAAVMGACSMIRETGKFWTAVNYYADKHNVDKEEMIEYIRMGDGVCLDYMVDKDGNEGFRLFGRWSKLEYNPVWHEVFAMKPTPIYSDKYRKEEKK